jgi:hypothetical protein
MGEWMTVRQAARRFHKSESYIRNHLKKGDCSSYMHGYPIHLTETEADVFVLPFTLH